MFASGFRFPKRCCFPEVFGIRRVVPKRFHDEFGIFWGFEKSEGLFSRGKRGFSGRVVPARSASCSRPWCGLGSLTLGLGIGHCKLMTANCRFQIERVLVVGSRDLHVLDLGLRY